MAASWQTFRKIRATPSEILLAAGIREPQINVRDLALSLGIFVRFVDYIPVGFSGKAGIEKAEIGETAYIEVPRIHAEVRQRFTIAHEIGHLMLHEMPKDGFFRDDTYTGNPLEVQANAYAADLLVPMGFLEARVRKGNAKREVLAREFGVSQIMMDIRCAKLLRRFEQERY